jgi:XapX domain-containing protein
MLYTIKKEHYRGVGLERKFFMKIVLLAILTGFVVGFVFALFKLPIPAPPALAGIAGIVGIYLGYQVFKWVSTNLF